MDDEKFIRLAIREAKKRKAGDLIGTVIVKQGNVIAGLEFCRKRRRSLWAQRYQLYSGRLQKSSLR